jgi:protein-S-isoprenylcysteine O-methyltransferase Ste14
LRNLPIPEASLARIAAGVALEHVRPWRLKRARRSAGCSIIAAGSMIIATSLKAAGTTELDLPQRIVTTGPYAVTRNPMYAGWMLLHLGIGVITRSGWILATVPLAGAAIHRDVVSEERRLTEKFGDEYVQYCATVGRYLPKR